MSSAEPGEFERQLYGGQTEAELRERFPDPGSRWLAITTEDGAFVSSGGTWHSAGTNQRMDAVQVDNATTAGVGSSHGYRQTAKGGFAWSDLDWRADPDNPLIEGPETTDKGACFGHVIHAETVLDDPIDDWYFYWAPYKGGGDEGIYLSTAPEIDGPWSESTHLFSKEDVGGGDHISSPWPVWDPANERMNLYYHRNIRYQGPQVSEVVFSSDGVTGFTDGDPVSILPEKTDGSWDEDERSYLKVIRWQGGWIGLYQARDRLRNQHGIGWARSADGVNWEASPYPLFYNCQYANSDGQDGSGSSGTPFVVNGRLTVIYQTGTPGEPEDQQQQPYALPWDRRNQPVLGSGEPLGLTPTQEWEGGSNARKIESLLGPYRGRIWAFYHSLTPEGRHAIGLASAEV